MNPLWKMRETDLAVETPPVPEVAGQQWPPLISKLLAARGFTDSQQVDKLLFPKLADLKDPLVLKGMSQEIGRAHV